MNELLIKIFSKLFVLVEGRLSGIDYFGPCLDSQSPLDLVILMLGTNDLKLRFGLEDGLASP